MVKFGEGCVAEGGPKRGRCKLEKDACGVKKGEFRPRKGFCYPKLSTKDGGALLGESYHN